MAISTKVQTCLERASWIRKMFEEGARLRAIHGADKVFDFTLGNPTMEPPVAFRERLQELVTDPTPGMHRYMSNAGFADTREAVAAQIRRTSQSEVTGEQIIMTCGAGGALNTVLKTILNPDEEVLILAPYFVEYKFYVDNHGGTTKDVPTLPDSFQLDLDAIEQAINVHTRAIILNSPNNPTGVVYPREDLEKLGAMLARKQHELERQIYVISDEPYARIAYDGAEVPCIFDCIGNSVIATSHSKDLALPGERIGFLAANPEMDDLENFLAGAVFCNRVLGYVNAPALMQRAVATLQQESVDISAYQKKRDVLYNALSSLGFTMVKPDGAFYLFPESPLEDDLEFVRKAQEHLILLVPGAGFGMPGYFRIAYCLDDDLIENSLSAWEALAKDIGLKG